MTEATRWTAQSREALPWAVYDLTGRAENGRFVLYGVSRKALFRLDPYNVPAGGTLRPRVIAYARRGTAFRSVVVPPHLPVAPPATPTVTQTRTPKASRSPSASPKARGVLGA